MARHPKSARVDVKKLEAAARKEKYELMLIQHCRAAKLPKPTREYEFHPTRGWRFDLAFTPYKVAVEVDGGVYSQGRHTRGSGYEEDCIKYAEAALLGWTVFRFSTGQVQKGIAIDYLEKHLGHRSAAVDDLMKI